MLIMNNIQKKCVYIFCINNFWMLESSVEHDCGLESSIVQSKKSLIIIIIIFDLKN